MKTIEYNVDLAVVGGGIAGICTALSAARSGAKVLLMHDRPVLGGNASSEIRMWICGAHGENMRESGIVEELLLENLYRNPDGNYSIWDSVLYGKVRYQENLTLLLNTSCIEASMDGAKIYAIKGWQLNSETYYSVKAKYFADCSGDSILAPLSGAETRYGRESCHEFNEDIAPEVADKKTMGMSCLIQARETTTPHEFIAPEWAYKYNSKADLNNRNPELKGSQNFWWIELGGEGDSLHDSDYYRDELQKIVYGIWDLLKNGADYKDEYRNWELEWIGSLPGKRESRRYVGDVIMTQNDVRNGNFEDVVAYGGWSMDDHHPAGLNYSGAPTIFHMAPSPYGIPYRAMYSKNIENLFCAGRNISVTHSAMSSTRVMATCGVIGQAVGTAAGIAIANNCSPREVYAQHLTTLKQRLVYNDAYIPYYEYSYSNEVKSAQLTSSCGDGSGVRQGFNRIVDEVDSSWLAPIGSSIEYNFATPTFIKSTRTIWDSNLSRREHNIVALRHLDTPKYKLPTTLIKSFRVEYKDTRGNWNELTTVTNQHDRLSILPMEQECLGLRVTTLESHGDAEVRLFSWDFDTSIV